MTRIAILVLGLVLVAIFVPLAEGQSLPGGPSAPVSVDEKTKGESNMRYGFQGKMTTRPGQRDKVVAILLRGVNELKSIGCDLYVVSVSPAHPDVIWVNEVWASKQAHDDSLKLPSVKQAIAEAMPMLTGEFESIELTVAGGLGVPE